MIKSKQSHPVKIVLNQNVSKEMLISWIKLNHTPETGSTKLEEISTDSIELISPKLFFSILLKN